MSIYATPFEGVQVEAGATQAGALFISVKNTGAKVALLNGIALAPGEVRSYPFLGKPYQAIPYDPQGSELTILYIL